MHLTRAAALLAALLAVGCKTKNPNYCPDNPDMLCDQPDGGGASCSADDPCAIGECKLPEGVCVECLENAHCPAATPTCDLMANTCGKCEQHADCASGACLPTGACGDDTNVAYVAPQTGTDNTTCTAANKCTVFAKALQTGRKYIKLEGTYSDGVVIDNTNVTILAEQSPRAKFTRSSGIIFEVRGTSTVEVYDAEFDGGGNQTTGVSIPSGTTATLTLERVQVSQNDSGGVLVQSGTVNVYESQVNDNQAGGVLVQSGTVAVARSRIGLNQGGGVRVTGGTLNMSSSHVNDNQGGGIQVTGASTQYVITNNIIVYNGKGTGTPTSTVGGASVEPALASNRFQLNTVAFNQSDGGRSGGVDCNGTLVSAEGNLLYANSEMGTTSQATQRRGNCNFGMTFATATNVGNAPHIGFASPTAPPFSFKLTADSPMQVRDVLAPGGVCAGMDFEGEARPAGAGCELGADELAP